MRKLTLTRQRVLLILGIVLVLAVLLFFGFRFTRRFINRPTREPIKAWMTIPYVARAYDVPPWALYQTLGVVDELSPNNGTQTPNQRDPRNLKPIAAHASDLGITPDEAIAKLEQRIAQGPPYPPQPTAVPKPK